MGSTDFRLKIITFNELAVGFQLSSKEDYFSN